MSVKAFRARGTHDARSFHPTRGRIVLYTIRDPLSAPQVVALGRALQALDAKAQVHLDPERGELRIEGMLTAKQSAAAIRDAGLDSIVVAAAHVSGGSTCCGGCT